MSACRASSKLIFVSIRNSHTHKRVCQWAGSLPANPANKAAWLRVGEACCPNQLHLFHSTIFVHTILIGQPECQVAFEKAWKGSLLMNSVLSVNQKHGKQFKQRRLSRVASGIDGYKPAGLDVDDTGSSSSRLRRSGSAFACFLAWPSFAGFDTQIGHKQSQDALRKASELTSKTDGNCRPIDSPGPGC